MPADGNARQRDNPRDISDRGDAWERRSTFALGDRNMTQTDQRDTQSSGQDVALIVGGGPGISSSCARLFAKSGMRVAIAARNPDKAVLQNLEKTQGVRRYACDASEPAAVEL